MPLLKKSTLMVDLSHNEMLDFEDGEFSEFYTLIKGLNLHIKKNESSPLTSEILSKVDILLIANPINEYFSKKEVKTIIDFVRTGGRLFITSEYGSDFLQKTNLNDITKKHFGIYFEKNLLKENNNENENCSSILNIRQFEENEVTKNLRQIRFGGVCSLLLDKNAKPLIYANGSTWAEFYRESMEKWEKEEDNSEPYVIAAYTEYGKGKVITLGDIDILSDIPNIGITTLDNKTLIQNIFAWLMEPNDDKDAIFWTLNQMGDIQNQMKLMNQKILNLIESISFLEDRVSHLEQKYALLADKVSRQENKKETKQNKNFTLVK
ncbi:MAG: hypothetical protein R6U96_13370 [Promethearchaeia archaeon]